MSQSAPEGWEARTSGRTEPSWFADAQQQSRFAKLAKDIAAAVAVVGAGISSITAAYLLSKAGKQVAIIADGNIATGDSGNGITRGTIAGMILSDLIAGKKNRRAKLNFTTHPKGCQSAAIQEAATTKQKRNKIWTG